MGNVYASQYVCHTCVQVRCLELLDVEADASILLVCDRLHLMRLERVHRGHANLLFSKVIIVRR